MLDVIDLHTHILPGVDDGSKSLDESLHMLAYAKKIGINCCVLTPHVSVHRHFSYDKAAHEKKYQQLLDAVKDAKIEIKLVLGAEIDDQEKLNDTISKGYTLGDTNVVLIDYMFRKADISESVYQLRVLGYKVIIAHVERITYLSFNEIVDLKKDGALLQVNASHLLPFRYDRCTRMAKKLLKYGFIDLVASDAHHIEDYKNYLKSYTYVKVKKGKHIADLLFVKNQAKLLNLTLEEDYHHGPIV